MLESTVPTSLDSTAHIIQIALTPIFLLSGIATLLNVFGTRLARVADQAERISQAIASASGPEQHRLAHRMNALRRRSLALDAAVILGALGGVATCGAALTLFVGALRDATVANILFLLFGLAILCTLSALMVFGFEMLLSSRGIRERVAVRQSEVAEETGAPVDTRR
ncbi:DUF2721 domain-containing protein [Methylobacterium sp.]|jgi:hypothetical protein|uniref:DUF2721 domain-containing protein n=1 Tax=Methylobacterium sp. TaxID=409 RepID=UPI0025ECF634|nr:DUF2721 domain-containing protein [Methylobacterium sp.]MBY0256684.1 DUF2721 domain-containing protein [Methylobacterium sp.]